MSHKLTKSTSIVGAMTLISRVLGFMRDVLIAHAFGAGFGYDAFLIAFKIPNFLRRLFAEGAFSQAFVPILSELRTKKSHEEVKAFVARVFGNLTFILLVITILGIVGSTWLIRFFAPGFELDDPRRLLASDMLKITFSYGWLISLTAFFSGIQNTYGRFAMPAVTPVLLSLAMIFSTLVLAPLFEISVMSLAWGVLLGGFLQFALQLPMLKRIDMLPWPVIDWKNSEVKRLLWLMVPALLGASVTQINLMVDTIFASFLVAGSISWLYFAERLLEFPLGIFGIALATTILPHLSAHVAKKNHSQVNLSIDWALKWVVLIGAPAQMGLICLSVPIMSTLFFYGQFTELDLINSSTSLMAYSAGLLAFITMKVLLSVHYAHQNTKTPAKIALVAMLLNIVFNLILIGPFKHVGLALASTCSGIFNVAALAWCIYKRGQYQPKDFNRLFILKVLTATALMSAVLIFLNPELSLWVEASATKRAVMLSGLMGAALVVYFISLFIMGLRINHLAPPDASVPAVGYT